MLDIRLHTEMVSRMGDGPSSDTNSESSRSEKLSVKRSEGRINSRGEGACIDE